MGIFNTLSFIINHPLNRKNRASALWNFLKWQVGSRLVPGEVVYEWVDGVKFFVRPGETGLTQNVYTGLQEFEDMAFILHYVNQNDLFIDVGSNVGSYSLLGCGVKGARGYAFEPIFQTYKRLCGNIHLNRLETRIRTLNIGLGEKPGYLPFTMNENCTNHVFSKADKGDSIKVKMETLDELLRTEKPSVVKIDVEGYEVMVLRGAKKILKKPSLSAVLIETNKSGTRYGFREEQIDSIMFENDFMKYSYNPFNRMLQSLDNNYSSKGNTMFIRDINKVNKRILAAKHFEILGENI